MTMPQLQHALALHQQGMLDAAYDAYQLLLRKSPKDINALNFLGVLCFQRGNVQEGTRYLRKCLQVRPDFAQAHNNLGNGLMQAGMLKEAVHSFSRAVALAPDYVEAHHNLASAYGKQQDFERALVHARKTVDYAPGFAPGWATLALTYHGLKNLDEAQAAVERAELLAPGLPEVRLAWARVLWAQEKYLDAIAAYRTAIEKYRDDRDVLLEFGSRLREVGRADEALPYLQHYSTLVPDDVDGLKRLSAALKWLCREDEAEGILRKAVCLAPDRSDVLLDLSEILRTRKSFQEAEAIARRALELSPESLPASFQLAGVLSEMDRVDEALAHFERLLHDDPENLSLLSSFLFHANYSATLSSDHRYRMACQYGQVVEKMASAPFDSWIVDRQSPRLKVGLVSGDLLNHPVGMFLENVIPRVDRENVELIAYPSHRSIDDLSLRLMPHMSAWKPLSGMSDRSAAEMIRSDGVHILIDLSGHTEHNRLPLFAWRPAPVQVSWLGYFATTGVSAIDWFIADEAGAPPSMESQFVEKIWRLPESRLCFSPPVGGGEVAPLPALANGYVTFGSFQNLKKIRDQVLKVWVTVLSRVPTARLRIQSPAFADASVAAAFRDRFVAAGGAADRLLVFGPMARDQYLAAHREVDFILDTFPFNGGTTTCEALWMGVPTLSLAGDSLIARQGASMLTAAGLHDWVAGDEAEFVEKAVAFAADLEALSAIRAGLRDRVAHSALFDGERFARNLERALGDMWQDFLGHHPSAC